MRTLFCNEDGIRVCDGKVVLYMDSKENFASDFGAALPLAPARAVAYLYSPSERLRVLYDEKQNEDPQTDFSWGEMDALLTDEKMVAAAAAKAIRLTSPAAPARIVEIEQSISTATIGSVDPKTLSELKAMTLAEYSTWFDANFDTAAKLVNLLKRLTLLIIRRL